MAYSYDPYNPIRTVDGAYIKCPSTFAYNLQDVSSSDAGRTEDALMHKKRIAQKVSLNIAWANIPTEDVSAILKAFNPEYINVCYLDAKEGTYVTKRFYVGDRSVPMYSRVLNVWSNVSFNIIEQ